MKKINSLNFNLFKNFCTKETSAKIDINKFAKEVDRTLNLINDELELQDLQITENNVLTDGVLKINFTGNKNYVLNIQRPNMQIWLSSPISGPQRFEFDLASNSWKNNRNGKELLVILQDEINQILKENGSGTGSEIKKFNLI